MQPPGDGFKPKEESCQERQAPNIARNGIGIYLPGHALEAAHADDIFESLMIFRMVSSSNFPSACEAELRECDSLSPPSTGGH